MAVKARDKKERGIKLKGNQGIVRRMQTTKTRVEERKGGQRATIQPTDGSGIKPASWYVVPLFPNLVRLGINSCRIMGNRIWKKNDSIKEEPQPSCDPGLDKIVEMLVKTRGRKLR